MDRKENPVAKPFVKLGAEICSGFQGFFISADLELLVTSAPSKCKCSWPKSEAEPEFFFFFFWWRCDL